MRRDPAPGEACDRALAELDRVGRFYRLDAAPVAAALAPHLGDYFELTLGVDGFEVITGGVGPTVARSLARIAAAWRSPRRTTEAFLDCAARFPGRMLGLKLATPWAPPTLYVRVTAPMTDGTAFLAALPEAAGSVGEVRSRLSGNQTLYGLGFSSAGVALRVKTYTLTDAGFLSLRLGEGGVLPEEKAYAAETRFETPSPAWQRVVDFAREAFGVERFSHVGAKRLDAGVEHRLYLERVGAVATDWALR